MTHVKVAVSVRCKNQTIQSHIENVIKDALLPVGSVVSVDVVSGLLRWGELMRGGYMIMSINC